MVQVVRQDLMWNIWEQGENKEHGREWKEMRPQNRAESCNLRSHIKS